MPPFPTRWRSVGGLLAAFTRRPTAGVPVRVHSCGAVAEFHRASRTFHCGTKVDKCGPHTGWPQKKGWSLRYGTVLRKVKKTVTACEVKPVRVDSQPGTPV